MTELYQSLAVIWCSVTYWLGGFEIPWTKRGYKVIRRYIMPAGLCVFLILLGALWWKAFFSCVLLSGATHVGYQNKWWKFALVGFLFSVPALILSWPTFNWMAFFPFTYHLAYGIISLRFNRFSWSFVALLTGTGIGLAYVTSALIK